MGVTDVLDQIDATLTESCGGCNQPIPAESPSAWFCSADCQTAYHRARTTNPDEARGSFDVAPDQMRWRPDLVSATDDTGLTLQSEWPSGRFTCQVFRRDGGDWHIRLHDGHRFVGRDLAEADILIDTIATDAVERSAALWAGLERELTDPRHAVPPSWGDGLLSGEVWRRLVERLDEEALSPPGTWSRRPDEEPLGVGLTAASAGETAWVALYADDPSDRAAQPERHPWASRTVLTAGLMRQAAASILNCEGLGYLTPTLHPGDPLQIVGVDGSVVHEGVVVRTEPGDPGTWRISVAPPPSDPADVFARHMYDLRERIATGFGAAWQEIAERFDEALREREQRAGESAEELRERALAARRTRNTGPPQPHRTPRRIDPRSSR